MLSSIFAIFVLACATLIGNSTSVAAQVAAQAAPPPQPESAPESERLAEARAAIAADPENGSKLMEAFRAARNAGALDEALAYARRALRPSSNSDGKPLSKEDRDELTTALRTLDPLYAKRSEVEARYVDALLRTAGTFERKGFVANAVEVLARVLAVTNDPRAATALDALRDDPAKRRRVLRSGIVFPVTDATRRERERWAAESAARKSWEEAWTFRGDHYTVVTDIGYELGRDVLEAMESMHPVYRAVFPDGNRVNGASHCTIHIHATRAGFDAERPGLPVRTKGVYLTAERRVVTYDPRDEGRPRADLWSTLFHEAAHAFTSRFPATLPAWLDEGTACLFEGSGRHVRDSGVPFGVPVLRLSRIPQRLTDRPDAARAILAHRSNIPAHDYALAWAWIYFFHHYEDAKARTVYREPFRSYLASFAKDSAGEDPERGFVEAFVRRPADPAVRSIEDLESRFRTWILELHERVVGPPEAAAAWIEIASRQREAQRNEAAVASLRLALDRRPDDWRARFDLAAGLRAIGALDSALLEYRRLADRISDLQYLDAPVPGFDTLDANGLARRVAQEIRSIEPTTAESLPVNREAFRREIRDLSSESMTLGFPRTAIECLDRALALLGGDGALSARRDTARESLPDRTPRWQSISPAVAIESWELDEVAWKSVDGCCTSNADTPQIALFRRPGRAGTRFEVNLRLPDREGAGAGLVFGCDPEAMRVVLALANGPVIVGPVRDGVDDIRPLAAARKQAQTGITLELRESEVVIFVDGEAVGREPLDCDGDEIRFGLFAQTSDVRFEEIRLRIDESRGSAR